MSIEHEDRLVAAEQAILDSAALLSRAAAAGPAPVP
jgi:hypothetical protein